MVYKPDTFTTNIKTSGAKLLSVRVQDIILDDTHAKYKGEDDIGKILYTELNEPSPLEGQKDFPIARPFHYNISYIKRADDGSCAIL